MRAISHGPLSGCIHARARAAVVRSALEPRNVSEWPAGQPADRPADRAPVAPANVRFGCSALSQKENPMAAKKKPQYRVLIGCNFEPHGRAEPGDIVEGVPAGVVDAWLREEVIELVESDD